MTVRDTSIAMYHQLAADGVLSKQRLLAYEMIAKYEPCTAREVDIKVGGGQFKARSIQPAITWLVKSGAVIEVGQKVCEATGNTALMYECSGNRPSPVKKPKAITRAQAKQAYEALRECFSSLHPRHQEALTPVGKYLKERI